MIKCEICSRDFTLNETELSKKLNLKNIIGEKQLCLICRIKEDLKLKENTLINQPIINAWFNDFDKDFTDVDYCIYEGIFKTNKKPSKETLYIPTQEIAEDIADSVKELIETNKVNVIVCLRLRAMDKTSPFHLLCIDETKENLDKLDTKIGKQDYLSNCIDWLYKNKLN